MEQRQEVFNAFHHGSHGAGRAGYSGGPLPMHVDVCRYVDGKHVYYSQQHMDQHTCPGKTSAKTVNWAEEVDLDGEESEAPEEAGTP